MTLYELTGAMLDLYEKMSEPFPEDPEERELWEQALNDTLAMMAEDFADKADGYGRVLKQLQADADAIKAEKMRLARRQQGIEKNIEKMRERMKCAMLLTDKKRIKTELFTFSVGTRQELVIDDQSAVPEDLVKRTVTLDTKGIREHLKNNPDATFAHFEPKQTLTIR